jgi:prepilin-type N-terminal cleavage/methylation domain-containing protein
MHLREQNGFTLIEVMAAVVVLGLLVVPVFSMISGGLASSSIAADKTTAVSLTQEKLEMLKAKEFHDLKSNLMPVIENPVDGFSGFIRTTKISDVSSNLLIIDVTVVWKNGDFNATVLRTQGDFL